MTHVRVFANKIEKAQYAKDAREGLEIAAANAVMKLTTASKRRDYIAALPKQMQDGVKLRVKKLWEERKVNA